MNDETLITAENGDACQSEQHLFRIGNEVPDAIEFRARREEFRNALADALLDHARTHGARSYYNIQVMTEGSWRQIQNPKTGGVMAVTLDIAGEKNTCRTMFDWACNSVQMARDLCALADDMAKKSVT